MPKSRPYMPYLEFCCDLVHLLKPKVHHEDRQGVLGLLPHISIAVFQAAVQWSHTQQQVRGDCAHGCQALCKPGQQLAGRAGLLT